MISLEGTSPLINSINPWKPTAYPFVPGLSNLVFNLFVLLYTITRGALRPKRSNPSGLFVKKIAPRFVTVHKYRRAPVPFELQRGQPFSKACKAS